MPQHHVKDAEEFTKSESTMKLFANEKIAGVHRGRTITVQSFERFTYLKLVFHCPALKLFDYKTLRGIKIAISRKLA